MNVTLKCRLFWTYIDINNVFIKNVTMHKNKTFELELENFEQFV